MIELLELMDRTEYREPATKVVALTRGHRFRIFKLTDFPRIPGFCAWCGVRPVTNPRRKYCDETCSESAHLFCYPQSPQGKLYRLIDIQAGCCKGCGVCAVGYLLETGSKILRSVQERARAWNKPVPEKLSYFILGTAVGSVFELDHIKPIHKGGDGVGFENTQVLCVKCHRAKTAQDMKG